MAATGTVSRWTRYFTVASACWMVLLQGGRLAGASRRTAVVVGLFGAVLPMVFGMAYLLLPSYVGRTLASRRLPGVHFVLAYAAVAIFAVDGVAGLGDRTVALGGLLWTAGVAVFVGSLLYTVVPAVLDDPAIVLRSADRPQRSTRLATALLPVGVGYLVVGTVALCSSVGLVPDLVGATLARTVHYYAAGFVAVLIVALGVRLTTGFFHVAPPRYLAWTALLSAGVAPAVLAGNFWRAPWFQVGAGLEALAMAGYCGFVCVVAYRTDRRRVGLYGIVLGALAGAVAVGAAAALAFGVGAGPRIAVHATAILDGFVLLTIVGYAYQFFPVTAGQFRGATERTALATIALLAGGVGFGIVGVIAGTPAVATAGDLAALAGTAGYAYLMARRLLGGGT